MINACQAFPLEIGLTEPFEDRIDILFRELELAIKWHCPSVLLSIYSSEYVRADADVALERRICELGQNVHHIRLKSREDADISLMLSELADLSNVVVFIEGLRSGCGENDFAAFRALNNHREFFIENQVRVVFWLTENEAVNLAHYAPDYWAFRHRVIEFVDSPKPEQISPHVLESAWQGMEDVDGNIEDLDAKIALRTALLSDLPDGNESTAARANLLLTLGMLHWRRCDYDRSTQFLSTSLELAARLKDRRLKALCFNAIALVETGQGRIEEAIRAYHDAIELAPDQISPWNNLGNLYRKLGRHDEALEAFQKAIEQNSADTVSWNGLGELYCSLGRCGDAIYSFLKATELSPDYALLWNGLGNAYAHAGRLDEALEAYRKAIEIDRSMVSAWMGLGNIYKLQNSNENAKMAFHEAVEVDPRNAQAWSELGNACLSLDEHDEAIQAYNKAIELDYRGEQAYHSLAALYAEQGRLAEAIPLLQKGIEFSESVADKAFLWNRLGAAYRKLGKPEEAEAAYREADALDPDAAHSRETFAEADAEAGSGEPSKEEPVAPALNLESETSQAEPSAAEPAPVSSPVEAEAAKPDDFLGWLEGLVQTSPTAEEASEAGDVSTEGNGIRFESLGDIDAIPEPADILAEMAETDEQGADKAEVVAESAVVPADKEVSASASQASEAGEAVVSTDETEAAPLETLEASSLSEALVEDSASVSEAQTVEAAEAPETKEAPLASAEAQDEKIHVRRPIPGIDAKNAQIWNELGGIYFNAGAYEEAIQAFNKAIELDHSYGQPYSSLASIYYQKQRYAEAVLLYQKAIRFQRETREKALLWNKLGDTYRRMDEHGNAVIAYQKAAELDPGHVSLLTRARLSLQGNHRVRPIHVS